MLFLMVVIRYLEELLCVWDPMHNMTVHIWVRHIREMCEWDPTHNMTVHIWVRHIREMCEWDPTHNMTIHIWVRHMSETCEWDIQVRCVSGTRHVTRLYTSEHFVTHNMRLRLQHTATHYTTLQHTAIRCNTLTDTQHRYASSTYCNTL